MIPVVFADFLNKLSMIFRVSVHTLIGAIFFRHKRHFFQLFKILDSAINMKRRNEYSAPCLCLKLV
jgi:hypothetical protein